MNKIDKNNIADILPLSPTQEGMLFYYRLQKDSNLYFEQHRLTLRGKFQLELFTQAVSMAFEANEMLRTVFRWEGLQAPVQLISSKRHWRFLISIGASYHPERVKENCPPCCHRTSKHLSRLSWAIPFVFK